MIVTSNLSVSKGSTLTQSQTKHKTKVSESRKMEGQRFGLVSPICGEHEQSARWHWKAEGRGLDIGIRRQDSLDLCLHLILFEFGKQSCPDVSMS